MPPDPGEGDGRETRVEKPAARTSQVFEAGDIVASRYHIVRFIAEGGMGEVYEARDTELAERLALKTIRGEYAKRPLLLAKFKREIHVARQVTHPNVCRVYDFGQHQGTVFLTMQLLVGETLADMIKHRERIPIDEALPIARQIAAAIDAAHRAGVVHRDLKPGNVMLLPPTPPSTVPHAIVTDFGLARAHNDDPAHDLSLSGEVAGSPAYMAPEQVQGSEVGHLADIYSFGILLFEMVTGKRPFDSGGTISTAAKRLVQPPPSPREFVANIDERWERAILRCLAREPTKRFASATEAIAAIQGVSPSRRRRQTALLLAAGALLAGAVSGFVIVKLHRPNGASVAPRRAVAVMGFKNLAAQADTAWISPALSEMFATELGGAMRSVPGQDVARARIELSLPEADTFDTGTLAKIQADIGADVVIVGSYLTFGSQHDQVRLDLKIQDTHSGETMTTISEQGAIAELPDLVERTGTKLRTALGLARASPELAGQVRVALPTNREAARLYAEGLEKLHRLEIVAARDSLEQAATLEPEHPLIRAALAEAWAELGYDARARDQAKLALAHADRLSPSGRMLIQARYHLAAKEWAPAIEAFRKLSTESPDDLDAGLQLAHAQIAAQRPKDALVTLALLHDSDPRIDLEAARAHSLLSNLPAQRDAAARAAEQADRSGAMLLAARARLEQANALLPLGDTKKALENIDAAERAFKQAHEVRGLAFATHARGLVLYEQGKFDEGDELEAKAASYFREVGSVQPLARTLMNLGVIASRRSDAKLSLERFHDAIDVARSADDRWILALALSGLADTERLIGHLDDAKRDEAEALDHARATQSRRAEGYIVQTLGQIGLVQADLGEAERRAHETLPIAESISEPRMIALTELELGRARIEANDLLGARDHLERALAAHTKAAETADAAVVETEIAEVELADGHPTEAIDHAQRAATALDKAPTDLAHALAVLARAQVASGKLDDARATATKAEAAGKLAYPEGRIRAALAIAAVQVADHKIAQARTTLAGAYTEATQLGFVLAAMYCELAAAELERDHGKAADGTARLTALAERAKTRGLMRLAALATKSK